MSTTNKQEDPKKEYSPRLTIMNLLKTAQAELEELYSNTYEAMAIRNQYRSAIYSVKEAISTLGRVNKIQEIRQTPCYVREGGKIRKMTLDEIIKSIDDEGFSAL